jgi:hypothetical protein
MYAVLGIAAYLYIGGSLFAGCFSTFYQDKNTLFAHTKIIIRRDCSERGFLAKWIML